MRSHQHAAGGQGRQTGVARRPGEADTGGVDAPDVRYTSSGDVAIAYYVVGEGPLDLVFVPFTISMVFAWHLPVFRDFCLRLSSFSRLILFDKRGIGASDRPRTPPTLEAQMEDVRVVLDAAGSADCRSSRILRHPYPWRRLGVGRATGRVGSAAAREWGTLSSPDR